MADEEMTVDAAQATTPASNDQQQVVTENASAPESELETEVELETETEGDEGDGDENAEPELVEVEYEGKIHKLPPELKDAILRQADYTRKTQEVAEQRKAVEARQAEVEQAYTVSQEVLEARSAIIQINSALKQYEGVNWQQLEAEDPIGAMSHWRQYQQLQQQAGKVGEYLDKTQKEMSEKAAQETDKRLRETVEFAQKELKGWSKELDNKITEFAVNDLGFTVDALRESYNPQVYKTLYLAHIGHQALMKQNTAPKQQAPAAQPLTKVASRTSPPAGLDDRLSQDEWLKRRQAQLKRS